MLTGAGVKDSRSKSAAHTLLVLFVLDLQVLEGAHIVNALKPTADIQHS